MSKQGYDPTSIYSKPDLHLMPRKSGNKPDLHLMLRKSGNKPDLHLMPWTPQVLRNAIKYWLSDVSHFSRLVLGRPLRSYQLEPARAILQSMLGRGAGSNAARPRPR